MVTCCPLQSNDEYADLANVTTPIARVEHRCFECREVIPPGSKYELSKLLGDGQWSTYKTCFSCVEIRDHFACNGWIYGEVWSDIEQNFFPDMKAGGPCMEGLSPAAKARLFERCLAWKMKRERD